MSSAWPSTLQTHVPVTSPTASFCSLSCHTPPHQGTFSPTTEVPATHPCHASQKPQNHAQHSPVLAARVSPTPHQVDFTLTSAEDFCFPLFPSPLPRQATVSGHCSASVPFQYLLHSEEGDHFTTRIQLGHSPCGTFQRLSALSEQGQSP